MNRFIARCRGAAFSCWCRIFRRNINIAPGLCLYNRLKITGNGKISIGRNCRVDGIIGDTRQYCCISMGTPDSEVQIGDNVALYAVKIGARFSVSIGNNALIEETSLVDTAYHSIDKFRTTPPPNESAEMCKVTIGENVCIGARSIVAKGVTVGNNCVVGPGSVVTRSLPEGCTAWGNPARVEDSKMAVGSKL